MLSEKFTIFKKIFSKIDWWAAATVLTLLLNSNSILAGYEQLSYDQFNRNLSSCAVL